MERIEGAKHCERQRLSDRTILRTHTYGGQNDCMTQLTGAADYTARLFQLCVGSPSGGPERGTGLPVQPFKPN